MPEDPYVYVACGGGHIFTYTEESESWSKCNVVDEDWNPADEAGLGFSSNKWSHVTYETVKDGKTVDVLIMSNADDGMVVLYGTGKDAMTVQRRPLRIGDVDGSNLAGEVRFACLSRHAERIWGTGDPD